MNILLLNNFNVCFKHKLIIESLIFQSNYFHTIIYEDDFLTQSSSIINYVYGCFIMNELFLILISLNNQKMKTFFVKT